MPRVIPTEKFPSVGNGKDSIFATIVDDEIGVKIVEPVMVQKLEEMKIKKGSKHIKLAGKRARLKNDHQMFFKYFPVSSKAIYQQQENQGMSSLKHFMKLSTPSLFEMQLECGLYFADGDYLSKSQLSSRVDNNDGTLLKDVWVYVYMKYYFSNLLSGV